MNSLVKAIKGRLNVTRDSDLVSYVKRVYDAPNLWQVVRKGGWRALLDGSLAEEVMCLLETSESQELSATAPMSGNFVQASNAPKPLKSSDMSC